MHVEAITIGPSDALAPVDSVRAVAGLGLEGDRKARAGLVTGRALTLIEAEVLEEVGLSAQEARRQVVVRGVRLNAGVVGPDREVPVLQVPRIPAVRGNAGGCRT